MTRRHTFLDSLTDIETRALASAPPAPVENRLKKLASMMRTTRELTLSYDELYGVRNAGYALPALPEISAPDLTGPGTDMRKMAHELRVADRAEGVARFHQAVDMIYAAEGLTLLSDFVGSRS